MRKTIPQVLASLLSLAFVLPTLAQETLDETIDVPQIRRYTVEVIIFKYAEEVSTGSEVFLPDEIPEEEIIDEQALLEEPEFPVVPAPEPEEEPEPLPDIEYVPLAEEDYQLDEVLEHLTRLDVYAPLMHFGWTQATWPEEQTEAIPLRRFAEPPEGLDGNLTLYLSRYLHFVVDLQLDAPPVPEIRTRDDMAAGGEFLGYVEDEPRFDDVPEAAAVHFRIQENRILKNGELRYYDHPKFGVLAMVTRVEEEDPDDSGELLGSGPE